MKKFMCNFHPDKEANFIGGYELCPECRRKLDRQAISTWILQLRTGHSRVGIDKILSEMFGTSDYGFSTFSTLYQMFPRATHTPRRGDLGFDIPQSEYIQKAFLSFIRR